jgi:hypothetical protein
MAMGADGTTGLALALAAALALAIKAAVSSASFEVLAEAIAVAAAAVGGVFAEAESGACCANAGVAIATTSRAVNFGQVTFALSFD